MLARAGARPARIDARGGVCRDARGRAPRRRDSAQEPALRPAPEAGSRELALRPPRASADHAPGRGPCRGVRLRREEGGHVPGARRRPPLRAADAPRPVPMAGVGMNGRCLLWFLQLVPDTGIPWPRIIACTRSFFSVFIVVHVGVMLDTFQ